MRLLPSTCVLALAASANAFAGLSPLVFFSTAKLAVQESPQLQTAAQATKALHGLLDSCPTERYHLLLQPNARPGDIRATTGCKIPSLCNAVSNDKINTVHSVAEVIGGIKLEDLASHIRESCSKQGKQARIWDTRLPPLTTSDRQSQLSANDHPLIEVFDAGLLAAESFTVIFFSDSTEPSTYEAEFTDTVHAGLKVQARSMPAKRADNGSDWDRLPLFEKYQFFSPGIFHGLLVSVFIFAILGVGIRALGSLEVSYAAFEKEQGPATQQKQN